MPSAPDIRHVILDRDGVLNHEAPDNGWITRPEDWIWQSGALEALRRLKEAGLRVSIASNQSGVGRGVMTAADLQRVTAKMKREAEAAGARIDEVVYCPHAPDAGCNCRKPRPGLLQALVDASGCPADQTILVGDAMRDLQAARALGIRALLVRTGKGRTTERGLRQEAVEVFDDLAAAAHAIIDGRVDKGEAD